MYVPANRYATNAPARSRASKVRAEQLAAQIASEQPTLNVAGLHRPAGSLLWAVSLTDTLTRRMYVVYSREHWDSVVLPQIAAARKGA